MLTKQMSFQIDFIVLRDSPQNIAKLFDIPVCTAPIEGYGKVMLSFCLSVHWEEGVLLLTSPGPFPGRGYW